MKIVSLLKPVLFLYEVFRVIILTVLLILNESDTSFYIKMIFATQGALFPLMALFLCIDTKRYREYLPLLIAGKCIGIVILLTWALLTRQTTKIEIFMGELALIIMDLTALAIILGIKKDIEKPEFTQGVHLATSETEVK
ncbi:MAG: hypothetical protein FWD26_01220 [Treponema sp.]|nr:hypothetical protein [Treponema sp.]